MTVKLKFSLSKKLKKGISWKVEWFLLSVTILGVAAVTKQTQQRESGRHQWVYYQFPVIQDSYTIHRSTSLIQNNLSKQLSDIELDIYIFPLSYFVMSPLICHHYHHHNKCSRLSPGRIIAFISEHLCVKETKLQCHHAAASLFDTSSKNKIWHIVINLHCYSHKRIIQPASQWNAHLLRHFHFIHENFQGYCIVGEQIRYNAYSNYHTCTAKWHKMAALRHSYWGN